MGYYNRGDVLGDIMDLSKYKPTSEEKGAYQGAFSTFAEYHALGVGFLAGIVDINALAPLIYAAIEGSQRRGGKGLKGHAKDASKELAYTALGLGIALVVRATMGGV